MSGITWLAARGAAGSQSINSKRSNRENHQHCTSSRKEVCPDRPESRASAINRKPTHESSRRTMQGALRQHMRGACKAISAAQHHDRGLHHSQHVGMPQHAILAREATVQMQKKVRRHVA